ncbi:MAG: hypothetical protein AAFP00_10495, partial [Bacteroidota bacterium]
LLEEEQNSYTICYGDNKEKLEPNGEKISLFLGKCKDFVNLEANRKDVYIMHEGKKYKVQLPIVPPMSH